MIQKLLCHVEQDVERTRGTLKLPEGYRLDLTEDPDAPALGRLDGTVAARFSAREVRFAERVSRAKFV